MSQTSNDTILQCFEWYLSEEGSFWKKAAALAPSFSSLGITMVWLPPATKGQAGIHDVGYGIYDLYDLGEFNQKGTVRTKYGTKQEYLAAVKAMHQNGMKVLADVVFNQKMGADETEEVEAIEDNPSNREQDISGTEMITAWTKFTFPGRQGKYDPFIWDHTCFNGTDWDEKSHRSSIFRFVGKQWDSEVDPEDGNFDYLMGCDLDMTDPNVIEELNRWGRWYYDLVHPDGVRLDAVKHIHFDFFRDWLANMRSYARKDLFALGEYWNGDDGRLLHYLDVTNNTMSLFDVPLHYRFYDASHGWGNYDMGSIWNNTLVQQRPSQAVTFVDNHDTQPGQALQSWIEGWFKPLAYALILLTDKGIPCVFYGDLYGIPHDGYGPVAELPALIQIRYLLAYGQQTDYFDDANVVGFTRAGDNDHPDSGIAVVMSDNAGGTKQMYVSKALAGQTMVDALGHMHDEVKISQDGTGTFACDGGSVSVYIRKDALPLLNQKASDQSIRT